MCFRDFEIKHTNKQNKRGREHIVIDALNGFILGMTQQNKYKEKHIKQNTNILIVYNWFNVILNDIVHLLFRFRNLMYK